MERTRIVLIDMPPLLREIVREAIDGEPDLDVVAEHPGDVDVRHAVERDEADFVIVGSEAAAALGVPALIGGGARVRALELQGDGRNGVLYELRPHRVSLGEISPQTLVQSIRALPGWDGGGRARP